MESVGRDLSLGGLVRTRSCRSITARRDAALVRVTGAGVVGGEGAAPGWCALLGLVWWAARARHRAGVRYWVGRMSCAIDRPALGGLVCTRSR